MTDSQIDTKQKIVEAAAYLFGQKGYDGTSTREIGRRAGVNIASLNYHFKSKQNLMEIVATFACEGFKVRLQTIAASPTIKTTQDFALALHSTLLADGHKCLNEFKLFLEIKNPVGVLGEKPFGFEEMHGCLKNDLGVKVPESEYLWIHHVLFNYIIHTAIISVTPMGQRYNEKFLPDQQASNKKYLTQLVETLIRDLNNRYQ